MRAGFRGGAERWGDEFFDDFGHADFGHFDDAERWRADREPDRWWDDAAADSDHAECFAAFGGAERFGAEYPDDVAAVELGGDHEPYANDDHAERPAAYVVGALDVVQRDADRAACAAGSGSCG